MLPQPPSAFELCPVGRMQELRVNNKLSKTRLVHNSYHPVLRLDRVRLDHVSDIPSYLSACCLIAYDTHRHFASVALMRGDVCKCGYTDAYHYCSGDVQLI